MYVFHYKCTQHVFSVHLVTILCLIESLCCVYFSSLYNQLSFLGCQHCKLKHGLVTESTG